MNKFTKHIFLSLLFFSVSIYSQDSTASRKFSLFGYPFAYYTPETQFAVGAGGIATFYLGEDIILRPSKVTLSGYYTSNKQYSISFVPQFYFYKNKYFFSMDVKYEFIVDKFYGVGSDTPEIQNPEYSANNFYVTVEFRLPFTSRDDLKFGLLFDYKNFRLADKKSNPYLLNDYADFTKAKTLGLGFLWAWDTRNSIFFPTDGHYSKLLTEFYFREIGSDYDFNKIEFDIRNYFPLYEINTVGFQIYGKLARGNPPFYELPALGGQYLMRGYYQGRFRDNNYLAAQIEYRRYVWKRIGFVVFFGMGDVAHKFNEMRIRDMKYSYGFGVRYQFNVIEKVNLRADFGFGKNTSGVYFGIEEVF